MTCMKCLPYEDELVREMLGHDRSEGLCRLSSAHEGFHLSVGFRTGVYWKCDAQDKPEIVRKVPETEVLNILGGD